MVGNPGYTHRVSTQCEFYVVREDRTHISRDGVNVANNGKCTEHGVGRRWVGKYADIADDEASERTA